MSDRYSSPSLHPQCAALLRALQARNEPPVHQMTPAQARDAYQSRCGLVQTPRPEVEKVEDVLVPVGDRRLGLRIYWPLGSADGEALPGLVYFHGGGWLIGNLETHDTLCRELCNEAQVCVVAVDYRLSPEHPYPAALEDARAALAWVFENAHDAGIDARRIAVGGDSAGANLAAVSCIESRDVEGREIAFQLLVYPVADLRFQTDSFVRNGEGYLLTRTLMAYFARQYAGATDLLDWRLSPALCQSLQGLPPALVLVAGFDPLHDEGVDYAQRLSAAGVRATLVNFERQIHGFITMGKVIDEANDAVAVCAAALRRALR